MKALKNIGPNLTKIGKGSPFTVPDRYFENFSARLDEKIRAEKKHSVPVKFISTWKPYLAAAVILIVALIAGNHFSNTNTSIRTAERLNLEISRAVEQELYAISEETIIEAMEENINDYPGSKTDNADEMIDYLLNEDLNEEDLMNSL